MAPNTTGPILIVDDTEANIDILVESLGQDYDVSVALSGAEALDSISDELPELILLDVMMPEMDGYEVCRRLKADERTADVPVIFITALSDSADEAKGLELGAIDYITKPFNPAIVKARVKNHLALREAARLKDDVERIMRHDLKSPLTAVISLPQLLLMDDNLDASQRDMLLRIEDAGYTLLSMINLSTTIFKMEHGTYQLTPEPMDLASLMRKLFGSLEDTAQLRDIQLQLRIQDQDALPEDAFPFKCEELLCHSMFSNLLGNALDASPAGTNITVQIERTAQKNVSIAISNQGEVPVEIQERFFEKYATAGKSRGTGLGTYSARLIANAHGGDISMQSKDGLVCVRVLLPEL